MDNYQALKVFYNDVLVGTLYKSTSRLTAFKYDDDFLINGFSISPFSLPLIKKEFTPSYDPFFGIFGVFNDSLPDNWGRTITDKFLKKQGLEIDNKDPLNRLALLCGNTIGALTYKPKHNFSLNLKDLNLNYDTIFDDCSKILKKKALENVDNYDLLFYLGNGIGGYRPKIVTKIDNEDWIVKFPSNYDSKDIGYIEYQYSLCAKECGLKMSETRLIEVKKGPGYFATKRFDRKDNKKIHVLSVSALLETSHLIPNLDYNILMKVTENLTKDFEDIVMLFRFMCFNVFAHNRDDHAKNFSYYYDEDSKGWHLAPAYDLTYSNSYLNEHATTINDEGKNPTIKDLMEVANNIKIPEHKAKSIALDIEERCRELLKLLKPYIKK